MPLLIRTAQRGLTTLHRENPSGVPSPGPVDGIWGRLTTLSFAAWARGYLGETWVPSIAIEDGDHVVIDPDQERGPRVGETLETGLAEAATRYRAVAPVASPTTPRTAGGYDPLLDPGLSAVERDPPGIEPTVPERTMLPELVVPSRRPRPEDAGLAPIPYAALQPRRTKWGWWAVGATLLVGAIGLAWWWQRRRK